MRKLVLLMALIVSVPALAAAPGSAQNFLDRAHRLKTKGPFAFLDSDYGKLKAEATVVGKSIGDDRIASEKAGRPIFYCSPSPRAQLGSFETSTGWKRSPQASVLA